MSNRTSHSSHRHHSGGGPSHSARSSSGQQYVLPATTYAGSGGGHHSGSSNPGSSSNGTLGRIYDLYDRPGGSTNTPPRRGSQPSQPSQRSGEIQIGFRGSNPSTSGSIPVQSAGSRPPSRQESLHSVYTTASRVVPVGQDSGGRHSAAGARVSNTSSEVRRVEGARRAVGNTAAYIAQLDFGETEPATHVYDANSKSAELLARLRRQEEQRAAAGNNPIKKFIQKSREELERRMRRKKK